MRIFLVVVCVCAYVSAGQLRVHSELYLLESTPVLRKYDGLYNYSTHSTVCVITQLLHNACTCADNLVKHAQEAIVHFEFQKLEAVKTGIYYVCWFV